MTQRRQSEAVVDFLDLVIDTLAVYRLTKLVIDDKITEDVRDKVWEKYGTPAESKIGYLLTCPWCVSIYASAVVVSGRTMAPKAWKTVARGLALSALTGLLAERT